VHQLLTFPVYLWHVLLLLLLHAMSVSGEPRRAYQVSLGEADA